MTPTWQNITKEGNEEGGPDKAGEENRGALTPTTQTESSKGNEGKVRDRPKEMTPTALAVILRRHMVKRMGETRILIVLA